MHAPDAMLVPAGDGSVWLVQVQDDELSASRVGPDGLAEFQRFTERTPSGWDANVDSTGTLWVVWADEGYNGTFVFACHRTGDAWGTRLQVSTGGGDTEPCVVPDEYGNVWVIWKASAGGHSIRMCRMGPRSGQETPVASAEADGPLEAASRGGNVYVRYQVIRPNGFRESYFVVGTEHGGFGTPVRV